LGVGYHFSETNRRVLSAGNSNIVTMLISRPIKGHDLPIQVHQQYGLEFHLILNESNDSCISRGFLYHENARKFCLQLENSALQGLCLCVFDDSRVLSMSDKVEQCFRAKPIEFVAKISDSDLRARTRE